MSECKHDWKNENWLSINAKCELCGVVLSWKDINEQLRQQLQAAEQQNAQLRADLAQREAEGAAMRGALEAAEEQFDHINDTGFRVSSDFRRAELAINHALSTSSGQDILELVEATGELIEARSQEEDLTKSLDKLLKVYIKLKVKGYKNEWGDY